MFSVVGDLHHSTARKPKESLVTNHKTIDKGKYNDVRVTVKVDKSQKRYPKEASTHEQTAKIA